MSKKFYCQSDIEMNPSCKTQCEHCKAYYAPLEEENEKYRVIPNEIDYRSFSHRVFPNSKNPENLWRQKEYQTGKYKFTDKDKEEIKKQLILLSDEIKLFTERLNL